MPLSEKIWSLLAIPIIGGFLLPLFLCSIVYYVFRQKDEFSWHAVQNTSATIVITLMNFFAIVWFIDDINKLAQNAYNSLGIPKLDPSFWDGVPFPALILVAIVSRDFADYWSHRLMHTAWLWPTHAAHHSDTHVNAFTTFRVHALESFVMNSSYILLLTWLQLPQTILFALIFSSIHNYYVHMNLPFHHGPLRLLIASPVFHRWHHADTPAAYGKNLANMMPIWDKLFGTYYYPGRCNEKMGALSTGIEDKNPLLIYVYPLQEWARLIKTRLGKPKPTTSKHQN